MSSLLLHAVGVLVSRKQGNLCVTAAKRQLGLEGIPGWSKKGENNIFSNRFGMFELSSAWWLIFEGGNRLRH